MDIRKIIQKTSPGLLLAAVTLLAATKFISAYHAGKRTKSGH